MSKSQQQSQTGLMRRYLSKSSQRKKRKDSKLSKSKSKEQSDFKLGKKCVCKNSNSSEKTRGSSKTKIPKENLNQQMSYQNINNIFQFNYQVLKNSFDLCLSKSKNIKQCKKLLPDFLDTKLPENMEYLCHLCEKIDQYLYNLSKKTIIDSFENTKRYLQAHQQIYDFDLHKLQQISYILPQYYNYFRDPLNKLVIGIDISWKNKKNIRKQILRQKFYQDYIVNKNTKNIKIELNDKQRKQYHNENEEKKIQQASLDQLVIPNIPLKTKRTQNFFPLKKLQKQQKQKKHKKQTSQNKLKQQFLDTIKNPIKNLQEKYKQKYNQNVQRQQIDYQNLKKAIKLINNYFKKRNITNIYKVSLIKYLVQQERMQQIQVILIVQYLLLEGQSSFLRIVERQIQYGIILNFDKELYLKYLTKMKKQQKSDKVLQQKQRQKQVYK